ncbi:hypothetical protein [Falsiroseomonas sp.]|uniref:hypothetical protein n=1 Tax=Falsiroseomonas sp. TaxID=2870721 RepID=UPI003F6FBC66
MSTEPLILALVEWVAPHPRPYAAVMEPWRTNCPRLTVWEDVVERGLVICTAAPDGALMVAATEAGRRALAKRLSPAAPP